MRSGGDRRGSSASRRRRKLRLLADPHLSPDGPGASQCIHCNCELTYETLEQDRIVPGDPYRYANVVPACRTCNARRGNRPLASFPVRLSFPA